MTKLKFTRILSLALLGAALVQSVCAGETNAVQQSVRFIYLVSADREVRPEYTQAITQAARDVQAWIGKQLGGATFQLNEPVVEVVRSEQSAAWFNTHSNSTEKANWGFYNALAEMKRLRQTKPGQDSWVWVIYSDGPGNNGRAIPGFAYLPEDDLLGLVGRHPTQKSINRWIAGLGHELGHALGLPHPQDTKKDYDALMWAGFYGKYPDKGCYLTQQDKEILGRNPFIQDRQAKAEAVDTP